MTFDANEFWAGDLAVQHHTYTHTQQNFQNITRVTMTYEQKVTIMNRNYYFRNSRATNITHWDIDHK